MTRKPAVAPPSRPPAGGRILVAAHSHPLLSKGGAEIAAWRNHEAMAAAPGWQSWFMGCAREAAPRAGSVITQPFGPQQYLYTSTGFDWFKFANRDPNYPRELKAILADIRPDILHFHHYAIFGVETFLHIREVLPDSRIVLTLHEFQAICHHYGQMITPGRRELCEAATLRDCQRCFPEISRGDFYLRAAYARRFLDLVDHFVAPSSFLAERYIAWGIDRSRVSVIENITAPGPADPQPAPAGPRLRVGFFGQISWLKGIQVLLDAAALLEDDGVTDVRFDIHGDDASQPEDFRADFAARLKSAGRNVRFHGAYDNRAVDRLMASVDAVVLPSIWWENSPVVIQEARRNRRPVICSDIGGMAEKVRDGIDGLHFPAGDATSLADLLAGLARDRSRLAALAPAFTPTDHAAAHRALYERLRG